MVSKGIGQRLKAARTHAGMTVRDMEKHVGRSHGTITNAENEKYGLTIQVIEAWARATGVSTSWLATGEGEGPPTIGEPEVTSRIAAHEMASIREVGRPRGEATVFWRIPKAMCRYVLKAEAKHLVVRQVNSDGIPGVSAGDYVFIDTSQREPVKGAVMLAQDANGAVIAARDRAGKIVGRAVGHLRPM
ncbi:helix-turn-helix transcriptional regulator [Rhodoplanes sp. TEM]|uniref:Helix-turn-helix transcriptional regulator n=1 Tax=Rhodoplanes tepidamans TaxID=200616 RepID=A0ABT5J5B0_RHOTP|nr:MULTISPECIES: helix-turn-helix transcriptional regulator [Rhodoplanes]MDC7784811.1 helix-turn-helix transcriptional regulator [Rhodoplanes tepidamans]MDC7982278.1 helix-turn-helix transcriptional regulator [Rhodoplanes sp. TEM]MDQ0356285.1 transcriptional regulator with XRE-family HTH domain [Rhodoplanes tepidamans]